MDRRTGIRLTIAAGVAIGLSFGVTPQLVAGSTDSGVTETGSPAGAASVDEDVWPTDLHPATPTTVTAVAAEEAPAATTDLEAEVATVDSPEVQVAPTPAPAPEPAPAPVAPAPTTPPEPVVEEDMKSNGTIHVDVATTEGAHRSVSLETADGSLVGGPVAVDGSRITFSDVPDGTYDLFVEQTADGGGVFVTRTTLVASGGEIVVTCDADSLDCTVA